MNPAGGLMMTENFHVRDSGGGLDDGDKWIRMVALK